MWKIEWKKSFQDERLIYIDMKFWKTCKAYKQDALCIGQQQAKIFFFSLLDHYEGWGQERQLLVVQPDRDE